MSAPEIIRSLEAHKRWLGYLQPDGLVVSAAALVDKGHYYNEGQRQRQIEFIDHLTSCQNYSEENGAVEITDFKILAVQFLEWPTQEWIDAVALPDRYHLYLKESGETLSPVAALHLPKGQRQGLSDDQSPYQLLLFTSGHSEGHFDQPYEVIQNTWLTSATRRLERLLRETGVPTGLLLSKTAIRLVYAPQGENSGHLTFRYADMVGTMGRPILGAFELLLGRSMLFLGDSKNQLPALLRHSREMQANVSTQLARQVLDGLYDLVRGTQAADARTQGLLLRHLLTTDPNQIYEAQLNVLMRLVFLLFAEDRGLMPDSSLYNQHYALHSLYERLNRDAALHHDTMDERFGAWAQLLALFRLIHRGHRHRDLQLPARYGYLFDPDRFPFLEGRILNPETQRQENLGIPTIGDGTIHRLLKGLLFVKGEKISYRTLDVEQIGSVYETMMGFALTRAEGHTIAVRPQAAHGAAVNLNLDHLLSLSDAARHKHLTEETGRKLTGNRLQQFTSATIFEELLAALEGTTANSSLIAKNATPHVVPLGTILLQPTDERRRSGSHYTPRALSSPVVERTLQPILRALSFDGKGPTPQQVLELKICDPAVGSGAFLVESTRQLGDALVAAWAQYGNKPHIPPDEDEVLHARRLVVQRCVYGVDRNSMAADLCKLSLWLATLAKDHPFTFLDHAIRHGDSLVGVRKKQIAYFHWDTTSPDARQLILGQERLEKKLQRAFEFRRGILEAGDNIFPEVKAVQLRHAHDAIDEIRRLGDLLILGYFKAEKTTLTKLRESRENYLNQWTDSQGSSPDEIRRAIHLKREIATMKAGNDEPPVHPFHWELEFPEVFERPNPGFDAFVGNPPYAGKNNVAAGNAKNYPDWLKTLHDESHGNADLVAHFFRRAFNLLRRDGTFGLIATNTIRQGDTRHTGLRWICVNGGTIYAARRRYKWVGAAAVVVSVVWVAKGTPPAPFDLDGQSVPIITAYLFHDGGHENPAELSANAGLNSNGIKIYGSGFTFEEGDGSGGANTIDEMERAISKDSRNADRIFPYRGGEEVNDNPVHAHRRYVINFAEFPLRRNAFGSDWITADERMRNEWLRAGIVPLDFPDSVAADWPDLLDIVERKVKPERASVSNATCRNIWWQFERPRTEFVALVSKHSRMLVCSRHQPHWCITFISSEGVCSDALVMFAFHTDAALCLLQSRVHEIWARFFSGSIKDDLRYTPSDCFETFPFPAGLEMDAALEAAGREYYEARAALMVENQEGLTKTYNHFHDQEYDTPGIHRLRELHAALDQAVLAAYGWSDLVENGRCACEFLPDYYDDPAEEGGDPIPKSIRYRWPDATRDEILARLLKLNAERHAEEVRQGLHALTSSKKATAKKTPAKKRAKRAEEPMLSSTGKLPQQQTIQFPTDDLDIFRVEASDPTLQKLPIEARHPESDPQIYATALVAALLSEAKGELPWHQLRDSYILATSPRLMQGHALPEEQSRVSAWKQQWNETAGPQHLLQAILNLGGKNLAVDSTSSGEPIFQLQDGTVHNVEPHIGYDAWLALRVARPLLPELSLDVGDFDIQNLDHQILELVA